MLFEVKMSEGEQFGSADVRERLRLYAAVVAAAAEVYRKKGLPFREVMYSLLAAERSIRASILELCKAAEVCPIDLGGG